MYPRQHVVRTKEKKRTRGCKRVSLFGTYQLVDDGRQEQREGVERAVAAHVDDREGVRLPVLNTSPEVVHLEFFMLRAALLVGLEPADDARPVRVREKLGFVGEVVDHPIGSYAYEDRCKAL